MQGNDRTKTTPDIEEDTNRGRLESKPRERSSVTWAIHATEQLDTTLDQSIIILSDLSGLLAQSGPDDELTEEFNKALTRSGKHLVQIMFGIRRSRT